MHFKQAGYHAALVDLGLIKEAAKAGILKRIFSRSPKAAPVPMQGQNYGPQISGIADDSAANAFRTQMNAASPVKPSPILQSNFDSATFRGTPPKGLPVTAPSPAGVAPASFTPASASAPVDSTAPAARTGMLAFMRRNPLASVGMAGAGAGGLGYVAGMGAPPPGQPMQQYGQGPMGYQ